MVSIAGNLAGIWRIILVIGIDTGESVGHFGIGTTVTVPKWIRE